MQKGKIAAVVLLLVAVTCMACGGGNPGGPTGIGQGSPASDFTLKALDGREVSLSEYRGSVVLINFWATWCPPCRDEIPDIEQVYRARKDDGFMVLGVNVEEAGEAVAPFVKAMGMTYPVLLDEDGQVLKKYRAIGLPASVLVDRDGVIQVRHVGSLTKAQLEDYLAEVLP